MLPLCPHLQRATCTWAEGRDRTIHVPRLNRLSACCLPAPRFAEALASGLQGLGYDLEPSEVAILMSELDANDDGKVRQGGLVMGWGLVSHCFAMRARLTGRHGSGDVERC